jgi:hypothetical protein
MRTPLLPVNLASLLLLPLTLIALSAGCDGASPEPGEPDVPSPRVVLYADWEATEVFSTRGSKRPTSLILTTNRLELRPDDRSFVLRLEGTYAGGGPLLRDTLLLAGTFESGADQTLFRFADGPTYSGSVEGDADYPSAATIRFTDRYDEAAGLPWSTFPPIRFSGDAR